MQSQEGHRGVNGLPALGTQPHHLEAGLVDLLRELVDGNVTGSTHQYWAGGETFDYWGPYGPYSKTLWGEWAACCLPIALSS